MTKTFRPILEAGSAAADGAHGVTPSAIGQPRELESIFRCVFAEAPDALLVSDQEGRILFLNTQTERLFGYPAKDLIGKSIELLMPERFRARHAAQRSRYAAAPSFRPMGAGLELSGLRQDGTEFPVEISLSPLLVDSQTVFASAIRDVSDRKRIEGLLQRANQELQAAYSKIADLNQRLEQENLYLRQEVRLEHNHSNVVGQSAAIRHVLKQAEQVAATDTVVLIQGETGTGKELLARTIHDLSSRRSRHMVKINCAALPATLIESELFGREKGAYTGALTSSVGRFELADKSTILLDEVAELPLELQAKLLRVLQEGEFERLGSSKTLRVDVRVIAATNRDLSSAVAAGKFREDLFYRLSVFPICLPPLRERREDIEELVWHVLQDLGKRMGRNIQGIQSSTLKAFQNYSWPGNIRELRNVIERNLILHSGPIFRAKLPDASSHRHSHHLDEGGASIHEVEREHILRILRSTAWRVRGNHGAAAVLGLKPTTLESRMKKLKIQRRAAPPIFRANP
jgi:PAS domain S-box-containing protein